MECAYDLTLPATPTPKDLTFGEKLEKIQKYLPQGLTEKILSQKDRIEGERKQVTVMFADMAGFTPLVEMLGAEDAYSIMDQVYEILIHKVHDYEGTVNEMKGDGIVALYGAPIALEDAPQRAIRSAYAIHREMSRFSDTLKQGKEGLPLLKMRIGIHTGPVVVGTLGNDLRVEFKAVGDTVNLAARMEDLAEPGATYVTEETFKLTEGLFRYESLGEKAVKGKKEPVNAYRVIGLSTQRTRFDVSAEQGLTPFVGRARELELLLDGFERAKQGRGQAFSIIADAGVGKSRLLYEFRKRVETENVTFLEGKCLSYSQGVAYHPIIDIYKSNFDIREGDVDYQIVDKVKKGLSQFDIDDSSTLAYLLELLSVKDSGIDQIPMTPQGRKDQIIETMIRIPLKGSEAQPLILAIEDLHWMDKSSEEVLKFLLESISGARILLIFTYRPEFVHTWGGRSYHNQVNLNRLSNRESLAMAIDLLRTEDIEKELEELILEKTEGVPFFIEEFIKSLKELQIIERRDNSCCLAKDFQDMAIPATIQDVIMARVDSLPDAAKEVLQTGSVIEREFSYELIKKVTKISQEELLSILSILKDSELIYERGIYPQSIYIFKHALTREVVYDSILRKKRNQLHADVGRVIEELFLENIEEYYAILAEHLIAGEDYEKGAEYSNLAARKAARAALIYDAIPHAEKRITCLEKLPLTDEVQKKIIDARTILGSYLLNMTYFVEAKEAVDPIVDLALKHDYKKRLAQIHTIIGAHSYMVEEDFPKAISQLEEALTIAEEVNDIVTLSLANYWRGTVSSFNCEFKKVMPHMSIALDINRAANNLSWVSTYMSSISLFNVFEGKVNLAVQNGHEAIQIAEECGDNYSKALAHTSYGQSCYAKGNWKEAKEFLLKGNGFCERINLYSWSGIAQDQLGMLCFDIGEYQESIKHYLKAVSASEEGGRKSSSERNWSKLGALRAQAMTGDKDIELQTCYSYIHRNEIRIYEGISRRYVAEILLNMDDQHMDEAEEWIKQAIEADERNGMRWYLGRNYAFYAELLKQKGDQPNARENLNKAIEILNECGADGWVERYEKELAVL